MVRRRRYGYEYYGSYFPRTKAREVKGGIRAQSKRGAFAESWWAKRWIAVLESFHIGARLSRGRSYARKGQVLSIDVGEGAVKAAVQGSRRSPYKVAIKVKTLSSAAWKKLAKALSKRPLFVAKLLAGEMPQDIEEAFKDVGLSLFPERFNDLLTECTCPDWSNPCKHIAAVFYLLGEEFDRDPFLMFALRGMPRTKLLGLLGPGLAKQTTAQTEQEEATVDEPEQPVSEPLLSDASDFWKGNDAPDDLFGEVVVPPVTAALPKRLGKFPFWRGEVQLLDAVASVYERASQAGLGVFLGERVAHPSGEVTPP